MKEQTVKKMNICPYCHNKMHSNEGYSEVSERGLTKVQCAYCNKTYKIKADKEYWKMMGNVWGKENVPKYAQKFLK